MIKSLLKPALALFCLFVFFSGFARNEEIYKIELDYPGFGKINFYMTFEMDRDDSTFFAYTNPKSLYNLIPFYQQAYLSLFGKGKKNGAVLRIPEGSILNNQLSGEMTSYLGKFQFSATRKGNELSGKLTNSDMEFLFTAEKVVVKEKISEYDKLYHEIFAMLKTKIYNPKILHREDWEEFLENMEKALSHSIDDLDVLMAYFYYSPNVKTSHLYLTKTDPLEDISTKSANYSFEKINPQTSKLEFFAFSLNDRKAVKGLISQVETPNLIIDLRNCPGGDFSSLLLASYFVEQEKYVGYFLGNKYYTQHDNELPSSEKVQSIAPFMTGTLDDFFQQIRQEGILVGKVQPSEIHYDGKIYLLTSDRTASAAEPLAYFMKENNLATLIGETTSGEMLSAQSFNIYKDWYLTLPTANYYTIDNNLLEQVGVAPDIQTPSEEALEKTLDLINN